MDLNIEGTQDRFSIDFGTVWGGPGSLKIVFSYHSGTIFTIFGLLNIKSNLSHQKPRFWLRFGGHVGVEKLTSCLQEASWGRRKEFFRGPKKGRKKDEARPDGESARERPGETRELRKGGGVPLRTHKRGMPTYLAARTMCPRHGGGS